MVRSSFSQHTTFDRCKRWWYFQKVANIQVVTDMCYADGGNVVHKILEKWYNKEYKDLEEAKKDFANIWLEKKLDASKLSMTDNSYWLMCVEGINLNLNLTSTEFKILYDDIVAYIDAVNTNEDIIYDYKSSTRSEENEKEYADQMKLYSWLYYRKFNRLPKRCIVLYLKYSGSKSTLEINPTMEDIAQVHAWYDNILREMDDVKREQKLPPMCETCHFFCPYKEICTQAEEQNNFVIRIRGNNLFLEGVLTNLLIAGIKKKFSYELKDAYFIKKNNPMANTIINFWSDKHKSLPIGFLEGLKKTIDDYIKFKKINGKIIIIDERTFDNTKIDMPEKFINGKDLRPYQNEAVRMFLGKKIGLLQVGTGGGKTEIAIECIRHLGFKTLFIVDKVELLKQTRERIKNSLGIEVGIIGNSEMDVKPITVATIQTLIKHKKELSSYLNSIRLAIFDECHHTPARSYMAISRYMNNTEYRLGITATAMRDDGNDMCINAIVGSTIFTLSSKELIEQGHLVPPQITFIKDYMTEQEAEDLERSCKTGLINETDNYNMFYDKLIVHNEKRNNIIKKICEDNKDKKILVMVKLIEHGEILKELLGCDYIHGSLGKEDREKYMQEFKQSKNLMIGTISIFGEGLDFPSLDIIINASANRGEVRTIQSLGRVLRKLEGKKDAFYYDFIDYSKFFKAASYSRKKVLYKEGHEVLTISQNI
jgi:superfamily II DNA or RNA helicase